MMARALVVILLVVAAPIHGWAGCAWVLWSQTTTLVGGDGSPREWRPLGATDTEGSVTRESSNTWWSSPKA
jgi:hypothetical protein